MKSTRSPNRRAATSIRLIFGLAICLLIPVLLFAAAPTWWTTQGVFNGNPENDYAAVNQGQLKNIAVLADQELDENFSQFADTTAIDLLSGSLYNTTLNTNDYAAVNLGQLKTLVQPFYDVLLAGGYRGHPLENGHYPWYGKESSENDYAMANIGQVKNLFSFDDTLSSDGSGLPDWWEQEYGITLGSGTTAYSLAPRNDGSTYRNAYEEGLNPLDFYNGQAPTLSIVSGSGQNGNPGGFVPNPLIVSVNDANGNPMFNAPVTFSVLASSGKLVSTGSSSSGATLTVNANSYGRAVVYFQLPNVSGTQFQITFRPGSGNYGVSGTFTEYSDNGSGTFPSPNFNPQPVPVQSYPALDVTGGMASGTICAIALNDDNTGAFATGVGGSFTMSQTFNLASNSSGTTNSWQQNIEIGTPPGSTYSWSFSIDTLAPNGTVYGVWNVNAHVNNYGLECQNSNLTVADDGEYNGTFLPTSNGDDFIANANYGLGGGRNFGLLQ